jgi:alanyl-tRNA synthetase
MRVIADHLRALVFAIGDGEIPSNNKAGYVIRRILRRAVRYGYTFLNLREPFMFELVKVLVEQMGEVFTEIKEQQEFIERVIKEEELAFLRTLANGLTRFEKYADQNPKSEISGAFAFELYDTYGFPVDLTELIARENNMHVDLKGFDAEMEVQKSRSRAAQEKDAGDWVEVSSGDAQFVGYEKLTAESKILKYRKVEEKKKQYYQIVLDQTPFYAESGGQVGDTGVLLNGDQKIAVWDTKKENDLFIHMTADLPDPVSATLDARVNKQKRRATEYNHSATHLLHAALRQVLGDHVQQRGSLVSPSILRFDFSHFGKVTAEELQQIERLVNEKIRQNIQRITHESVALEDAKAMGAMALFGEKYGDKVRVVEFDPQFSIELCGGTHVDATGAIGMFKIITETSVASGVRRIEALTGLSAEEYVEQRLDLLHQINDLLKAPKDTIKALETILTERAETQKQLGILQAQQMQSVKQDLLQKVTNIQGVNRLIEQISLPHGEALKSLSFELRNQVKDLFAVLAADIGGKPQIAVVISDDLVKDRNWNAGAMVRELAQLIKGGGGGQPFYATAGGKDISGLPKVTTRAQELLDEMI